MSTPQAIAERYNALWLQTDAAQRRRDIEAFFAPDVRHYVNEREAIGYDALEARITASHEKNVRDGRNTFRVHSAQQLRGIVIFDWEMIPANAPKTVLAIGREVVGFNDRGQAVTDHMFILA